MQRPSGISEKDWQATPQSVRQLVLSLIPIIEQFQQITRQICEQVNNKPQDYLSSSPNSPIFNTAAVCEMIEDSFNHDEFTSFCFKYYRDIYRNLPPAMTLAVKVTNLVDYCERHGEIKRLVSLVEEHNPHQFGLYKDKIRKKDSRAFYPNSVSGLIEFQTTNPINLEELTEAQIYNFYSAVKLALANLLQLVPDQIAVVGLRAGSIILSLIMPIDAIRLLVNINKQNEGFFPAKFGLKLTFASGFIEQSEDNNIQATSEPESVIKQKRDANSKIKQHELAKKIQASKNDMIDAIWSTIRSSRKALLLYFPMRYYFEYYLYDHRELFDTLISIDALINPQSELVNILSKVEVSQAIEQENLRYISRDLSKIIANLDASLVIMSRFTRNIGSYRRRLSLFSPFNYLKFRKQRDRVNDLIKLLEKALKDAHKAAKLAALQWDSDI